MGKKLTTYIKAPIDDHASALVRIVELTAQRDELLEACRGLLETYVPETSEGYSDIGGVVHQSRAAIARATEGGTGQ